MSISTSAVLPEISKDQLRVYGRGEDPPVLFFPGTLGAHLLDDSNARRAAMNHRVRLMVADPTVPSWGIAVPHEIEGYGVVGFSWSAAQALALAARNDSVSAVGLIAPLPDLSHRRFKASLLPALSPLVTAARELRAHGVGAMTFEELRASLLPQLRRLWAALPASDRRVLHRALPQGSWVQALRALNPDDFSGLVEEVRSMFDPWGLDLGQVKQPVEMLFGGADPWSSDEVAHWFRRGLPHCHTARVNGAGHFSLMSEHCGELLNSIRERLNQEGS